MKLAYEDYMLSNSNTKISFEAWKTAKRQKSPHFQYWEITMKLEEIVLTFVLALRKGNFKLYIETVEKLIPCFFAFNHTNYARWLPIHLRDMISLKDNHPFVYTKFEQGCFVVWKTRRKFSAISVDHAHEQNNRYVKDDGGAIGLTEDSLQLLRWMIAGPEIAGAIAEFENESASDPSKRSS